MYVSCSENRKCGHVPLHCRTVASLPPHRAVVADLIPLAFSIKQLKRHTRPHLIRTSIYIYKFNVLNIQRISPNRILPCNFLALNWENFETFLELFSLRYASAGTVGVLWCVSMYYKKRNQEVFIIRLLLNTTITNQSVLRHGIWCIYTHKRSFVYYSICRALLHYVRRYTIESQHKQG